MIRGIGMRGAIAVNLITMIGIGPLITIPLVLAALPGTLSLVAWALGAAIALCDGLVWAELGSLYPGSGGTYAFLREAFGAHGPGRLFAFLFAWQTVLSTPLILATGYIGFANYAAYLWPALATSDLANHCLAAAVGVITLVALYRPVPAIGRLGIAIAGIAIATLAAVTFAGLAHFTPAHLAVPAARATWMPALVAGLGPALILTTYDYTGYGSAAMIGDEVFAPARIVPRSIVASIAIVFGLYVALQIAVLGAIPWQQLVPASPGAAAPASAQFVASTVVERSWGFAAAAAVTIAILVTAFGSVYGNLLGASRVPYAAAVDGVFLAPFARLHARHGFPATSLLVCGLLALPACFFSLGDVIAALTAGVVVIQNLGQIAALFRLRARGLRSPYRMWLFPLPAIFAAIAWVYIFCATGTVPIVLGIGSLCVGAAVYLVAARRRAAWPFAARALPLACALLFAVCGAAGAQVARGYGAGRIVEENGGPVFTVDGQPFFMYGAAFFYERLPRERWRDSMLALRAIGVNTLDLYVPWNWHELPDGAFDFDGHTNPRRDLREVLRLAHQYGFKLIVRPGPVIRNEWRNGGYPARLLELPEYGMPQRDLLEGRYPPTATLQNAHSDDAAAQWLANTTHRQNARRWLENALHQFDPYARDVLAVALDDDQGAYIDNQTWPAPNLTAYLLWLQSIVRGVVGPDVPTFINTYEMKVTASSPVWAMGNWYQSDAYRIGEHDLAQLAFSAGLLQTRPGQPLFMSEFQAGWLQQPGDVLPRPADPTNTTLAFGTLLGQGMRGIVNFPAQDTLDPAGMEAPFANWSYAWDAALPYDLRIRETPQGVRILNGAPRLGPVAQMGAIVREYGPQLARSQVLADAGIAYLTSAYEPATMTNERVAALAAQTLEAQRACALAGLSCRLVDLRFASDADLRRYPAIVAVRPAFASGAGAGGLGTVPDVDARLERYARTRGTLVALPATFSRSSLSAALSAALRRAAHRPLLERLPGATYAPDSPDSGFIVAINAANGARSYSGAVLNAPYARVRLPIVSVAPRSFALLRVVGTHVLDVTPRIGAERISAFEAPRDFANDDRTPASPNTSSATPAAAAGQAVAYASDVFADGMGAIVLENRDLRAVFSPDAGARAFVFENKATRRGVFTSVGAFRDDVLVEPPLSTSDRIAAYTHDFPAGFFNRSYSANIVQSGKRAIVRFAYVAPDAFPHGAVFARTVRLEADARCIVVDETAAFNGSDAQASAQRAVSVTSLALGNPREHDSQVMLPALTPLDSVATADVSDRFGLYDDATHEAALLVWTPGDDISHVARHGPSAVLRVTLSRRHATRILVDYETVAGAAGARSRLDALAAALLPPGPVLGMPQPCG